MCHFKSAILYLNSSDEVEFLTSPGTDSHASIAKRHDLERTLHKLNQEENEHVAFIELLHDRIKLDGPTEKSEYLYNGEIITQEDKERNPWVHEFVQSKLKVMCRYRNIVGYQKVKADKLAEIRSQQYKENAKKRKIQKKALLEAYPFERTMKDRQKLKRYKVDPKEYLKKKTQRALTINWDKEWKRQSVLRVLRKAPRIRKWAMKKVFQEITNQMMYLQSHGKFVQFKKTAGSYDYNFQQVWNVLTKVGTYTDRYTWRSHRFDLVCMLYPGDWTSYNRVPNDNSIHELMKTS